MRISDWSSDVCSSDLSGSTPKIRTVPARINPRTKRNATLCRTTAWLICALNDRWARTRAITEATRAKNMNVLNSSTGNEIRSEEHTSELQSLMRISYAVFCLKKKKRTTLLNKTNLNRL